MIHRQIPICLFVSNYHPAEQKGLGPRLLCHFSTKNKARQFYQNYRALMARLLCHFSTKNKARQFYQNYRALMVEARGVEPLSENASKGTSPGADAYFGIAPVFLRHRSNVKPAGRVASLCMVRSKLCARTSTTKSRPSPGRGPPGVDGLPNQAARATVLVSVNFRNLPGLKRSGTSARCSGLTIPVETGTPPYLRPETGAVVDYLNLA